VGVGDGRAVGKVENQCDRSSKDVTAGGGRRRSCEVRDARERESVKHSKLCLQV